MSICLSQTLLLFFVSRWNRAISWPSVLHDKIYKMLFFDFWFRSPNAKNLLPKICTKSPIISRIVWQINRRCWAYYGVSGWPIQWNHAKCCGDDPCCHGNEIWARRGDPVAYRLVTTCARFQTAGSNQLAESYNAHLYIAKTKRITITKLWLYVPINNTNLSNHDWTMHFLLAKDLQNNLFCMLSQENLLLYSFTCSAHHVSESSV